MSRIFEYRGVEGLVFAKILKDTLEEFETGPVKELAGVSRISRTTETSSEVHYYDNKPAVVVSSTGGDEVSMDASAIPLDTLAEITGQYYDETTGMLVEGENEDCYFAIGYITDSTDGSKVYVWRYKGRFEIPSSEHVTKDDGTDANGQELVYKGISTIHKFTKTGKSAKAINIDASKDLVDLSTFFAKVTTPDDVKQKNKAMPNSVNVK